VAFRTVTVVLDVGCGTGSLAFTLPEIPNVAEFIGIDLLKADGVRPVAIARRPGIGRARIYRGLAA
jgi:precorrin-6B methylase 2